MAELMGGCKGRFEFGNIERFGEVGEESSFFASVLRCLPG
jgi:hypothetical protein